MTFVDFISSTLVSSLFSVEFFVHAYVTRFTIKAVRGAQNCVQSQTREMSMPGINRSKYKENPKNK